LLLQTRGIREAMDRELNVKNAVVREVAAAMPSVDAAVDTAQRSARRAGLSTADFEVLMFAVDASLNLQSRPQFFGWSQGLLQGLLPHELLICAVLDPKSNAHALDSFHSQPFPDGCVEHLCRHEEGTVPHLMRLWQKRFHLPLHYQRGEEAMTVDSRIIADVGRFKLENMVAHGSCLANGDVGSFFMFACMPEKVGVRHAHVVELLVPYMHAAWVRILLNRPQAKQESVEPQALLTTRELEILGWVYEGKSNIDIGSILQISSLTVKNHVQKILRKLNVQNRTQAVSKGIMLKLLQR
jgi:transcriptional regulator EpsA